MEDAGLRLKRVRERLGLKYREVEEASQKIAARHGNDEFAVALSRLSDIENKGTVPTLYKLYSLCVIYRLELMEVMEWYGVRATEVVADAAALSHVHTHLIGFNPSGAGDIQLPLSLDPGVDLHHTTYLTRAIQRWGTLPALLLTGLSPKERRYAFIGTDDWFMYPLFAPGSFVEIDETKKDIETAEWNSEFERPVYFLELRQGYACCWCDVLGNQIALVPHPASGCSVQIVAARDVDIIGRVVAVAMRLDLGRRRRVRS
jgi:transcriptional regulator with XRE-family HTH domain